MTPSGDSPSGGRDAEATWRLPFGLTAVERRGAPDGRDHTRVAGRTRGRASESNGAGCGTRLASGRPPGHTARMFEQTPRDQFRFWFTFGTGPSGCRGGAA
ncbi:hypothetical protein GCM10012287_37170 [Streptomyces daqingensis]|uniref:Uncharacterized protein n=1 Tax=Streptomyces daqingensis TaxID=1472640 RepID=A0ABQ2MLY7_9ACTN|nr:hypothetical protein GCM10012287_37170 [Streptomyces daqingensis]